MLGKETIKETFHEKVEFVCPIFITTKSERGICLILNLRRLNGFVKYEHFKMDGNKTILNMITKIYYMATIDFKDTYYSVRINKHFKKFLKSQ